MNLFNLQLREVDDEFGSTIQLDTKGWIRTVSMKRLSSKMNVRAYLNRQPNSMINRSNGTEISIHPSLMVDYAIYLGNDRLTAHAQRIAGIYLVPYLPQGVLPSYDQIFPATVRSFSSRSYPHTQRVLV